MSNEFLDYLEDILDAMDKAEIIVKDTSYEQFENDFRTNFAAVRALEIIGEATKRLPQEITNKYSEIPWKGMAGMRDRIIHGYDNVDKQIVWDVIKKDIPVLKPRIQSILNSYRE